MSCILNKDTILKAAKAENLPALKLEIESA
jgi:hypothetical protein